MSARLQALSHHNVDPGLLDESGFLKIGRTRHGGDACLAESRKLPVQRKPKVKADNRGTDLQQHVQHILTSNERAVDFARLLRHGSTDLGKEWSEMPNPFSFPLNIPSGGLMTKQIDLKRSVRQRLRLLDRIPCLWDRGGTESE